jgi:tetratricopeptide (TPR) repeat protein
MAIEQRHAQPAGEEIDRLAHHSLRGELWEKAARYLRRAGVKASAQSADREAVAWLDQALIALGHLPAGRERDEQAIDVRLDLRAPLFHLAEFPRLISVLQEAQSLATDLDDRSRLGWVLVFLGNHTAQTGDLEQAAAYCEQAAHIADGLGDFALRLVASTYLGQVWFGMAEYRLAIEVLKETAERLQGDLLHERFRGQATAPSIPLRAFRVRSLCQVGRFDEGIHDAEDAVRIAEVIRQPFGLAVAYCVTGHVYASRGTVESAVPALERGLAITQTADAPSQLALAMSWLGHAYALGGRVDEGVALLEQGSAKAEAIAFTAGMAGITVLLGDAYLRAGRRNEAHASAQRGLEISRRLRRRGSEAEALYVLAEIAASSAPLDAGTAEAHYRQAMGLALERDMRPLAAHCRLGLGKLYQRTGQQQEACEHLTSATAMYRKMDMRLWLEKAEAEMRALG